MMHKIAIYTSIVGQYDPLLEMEAVDTSFDYICFSNDIPEGSAGIWQIRRIPYESSDSRLLSRYVKILPHKVLQDYDVSVWIDANILIKGQAFYKAIESAIEKDYLIAQVQHPSRDCAYDDMLECYALGKISLSELIKEKNYFKNTGFPSHFGLYENNLIFRRHNDPTVISLSESWWREYCIFKKRDQFSLPLVYWKADFKPALLLGEGKNTRNVDFLEYHIHKIKRTKLQIIKRRLHVFLTQKIIRL